MLYENDINMFNKNDTLKLLKYNNNELYFTIYIELYSYPIKIITDFDKYCFAESVNEKIGIDKFNLSICFKNKNVINIINELYENINKESQIEFKDSFHIYQKIDKYDKTNIDYFDLTNKFLEIIDITYKKNNDFLLSPTQTIQLIVNEIKKINSNKDYKHYITYDQSNILQLNTYLYFDSNEVIELKIIIDPYFYPFVPPKIEYIKPRIKLNLLFSIINLDILMLKNWCPTITLEYLITNLVNELKPIIQDYIIKDQTQSIENELEYEIINLCSHLKYNIENKVKINIPISKQQLIKTNEKNYWKSGTGYGTSSHTGWDIEKYIENQEYEKNKITKILYKINKLITSSTIYIINGSSLELYIINQTRDLTILELEKNIQLYKVIFEILYNLINNQISQSLINIITDNIKNFANEIIQLINLTPKLQNDELLLLITKVHDLFQKKYKEVIKEIIISQDIKEKYCQIMNPLQFGNYEIPNYHYYGKNNMKINQSAIMRTLSEISSFKTGLPLNWESTIWTRVSKTNFNIFSFIISGPKDTPYENGLFEFHAYFPIDYPNCAPEVIIYTTDNGKVRFNPNLYANGKVCLSLLGTWSGQESEKWNPKTSTFLQVMISIQSLILVEQPYFNEPGWEREMNTPKGKTNSDNYNKELHPHTIQLGMINMIKNPPPGFEQVIKNHFSIKKEEIINTISLWEESAIKHKELINKQRLELIELLNAL